MGVVLISNKRISIRIRIRISKAKSKVCKNGCAAGVRLRIRRGCGEVPSVQGGPQVRIQGWTAVVFGAATDTIKSQISIKNNPKNIQKRLKIAIFCQISYNN